MPTPDGHHTGNERQGQKWIAAIGIDRYRERPLRNAVNDARAVLDAFEGVGFQRIVEPLIDAAATRAALQELVTELEPRLTCSDSLVVFFAGHGRTFSPALDDPVPYRKGYLLPVDADHARRNTWLPLGDWLSELACLPPLHILVILDSCYSGLALEDVEKRARSGADSGTGARSCDAERGGRARDGAARCGWCR